MKANTIILWHGTREYVNNFEEGDTIFGLCADPEEIKRWNIKDEKQALEELKKCRCSYSTGRYDGYCIEEYALEFCECDEYGDFVEGSDYIFAEKEM